MLMTVKQIRKNYLTMNSFYTAIGLFLALVLGLASGTTSHLEFRLISKTLKTTILECSFTGEAGSNFHMNVKHNRRMIHFSKQTHLEFDVETPSCEEDKSYILCSAYNSGGLVSQITYENHPFYGEAEIFIHPKGSSTIPLSSTVKIECRVSDMCSKDDLFFGYSPHYFLKPVNTQINKTANNKRYSGIHVAEARFEQPGTFNLTCNSCKCCPERRSSTTKTVTVLKPEIKRATLQQERHQNALLGSPAEEPSVQDSQQEKQRAAAENDASVADRLNFKFALLIITIVVIIMQNGLIT